LITMTRTPMLSHQRTNIINFILSEQLTMPEVKALLRTTTGANVLDDLSKGQADMVLAAMIVKGDQLKPWCAGLNQTL
jgi:hypothetical protein